MKNILVTSELLTMKQAGFLVLLFLLEFSSGEIRRWKTLRAFQSFSIPSGPAPMKTRKPNKLENVGKPPPPPPPPTRRPIPTTTPAEEFGLTTVDSEMDTFPPIPEISNMTSAVVTDKPHEDVLPTSRPNRRPPPSPPTRRPPRPQSSKDDGLIYSSSKRDDDGSYFFDFLASNSVFRQESGYFKPDPQNRRNKIHIKTGTYGFTSPEGARVRIDYVADENGYRALDTTK